MRRSHPASWILALALAAGCSGSGGDTELVPVPEPALEGMDQPVRDSILGLRESLGQSTGSDLGRLYGDLGRIYYTFGLHDAAEACFLNARRLAEGEFAPVYFLGMIELERGRPQEAARWFETVLRLREDYTPARVRLGRALIETGELHRAREHFEHARSEEVFAAAAHYSLGQLATRSGNHRVAIENFERVLELQPQAKRVHYPLGQAYRGLGDHENADRHIGALGEGEVTFPDPLIAALTEVAAGVADRMNEAGHAFFAGEYEQAAASYRAAIDIDPDNVEARKGLALALARLGDASGAEEQFLEALRLRADDPDVERGLGLLLLSRGALETALDHLRRAEALDPGSVDAQVALAGALAQAGQLEEALGHYDRALEIDPLHRGARLDRAATLFNLGVAESTRGNETGAMQRYAEALAENPELGQARLFYAAGLARAGRYAEAAEHLTQVLEGEPLNLQARLAQATALAYSGRHGRARRVLEDGMERMEGQPLLALALAKLLATSPDGEVRDGTRALALAQGLYDEQPTMEHAEVLAMAFAEMGDFDRAANLQHELVAAAARMGQAELSDRFRLELVRYERGEPSRMPSPGHGGLDDENSDPR